MTTLMGQAFLRPDWLVPAAGLALGILLLGRLVSRRRRPRVVDLAALLVRGLGLAGLVLLAAGPVTRTGVSAPGVLLAAVDGSRSVHAADREALLGSLEQAAREAGSRLVAQRFAAGSLPMSAAAPAGWDLESDPVPALADLLLGPQAAGGGRLVLVTDGVTVPPPAGLGQAPGLGPLVLGSSGRRDPGVRVTGLELTGETLPGTAPRASLAYVSGRAAEALLVVHVDGREVRRVPVPIEVREGRLALGLPPLDPGRHVIAARLELPDDTAGDDAAAALVVVQRPPLVTVVSPAERPLVGSALAAQGHQVRLLPASAFLEDPARAAGADVVVLDRVPARDLGRPALTAWLERHLDTGGGLLHLPTEQPGELLSAAAAPFVGLLPVTAVPEPPPPPEPARLPEAGAPGLAPQDPEARETQRRLAPSLGLLLVIDASHSMKGDRLRLAKAAALAAAEVLHPEDLVGVIAFNDQPLVVLELCKADDRDRIRDRIARIQAGGGTDFGNALELVGEVFAPMDLAIRHAILLSDGESRPRPLGRIVSGLAAAGITLSAVGCGTDFNEQVLSDLAVWGHGKFHPAFSVNEIPQVFTIEVERVIEETGARRRRPKVPGEVAAERAPEARPEELPGVPRPEPEQRARPLRIRQAAPYTRLVAFRDVPGVLGLQRIAPRPGSWVSVEAGEGEPFAVHGYRGDGRVLSLGAPLEGAWSQPLSAWEDYQVFLSQAVRFLLPDVEHGRYLVDAWARGRLVQVRARERTLRRAPPEDLMLTLESPEGTPLAADVRRLSPGAWSVRLRPSETAAGVVARIEDPADGERSSAFAAVSPPPEVTGRGPDLPGLKRWAAALGGELAVALPVPFDVPASVELRERPGLCWLSLLVLPVLLLDLLLKRLAPGRMRS